MQPRVEGQESRAPRIYGPASLRCQCDEPVGGGGVAHHRREDEALVGERRVPVINQGGESGTNEVRGPRRWESVGGAYSAAARSTTEYERLLLSYEGRS